MQHPQLVIRRIIVTCVLLGTALLTDAVQAQDAPLSLPFSADQMHIQNLDLQRIVTLMPALRRNDFIRTYSPFDSLVLTLSDPHLTPLMRDELRERFGDSEPVVGLSYDNARNTIAVEPVLGVHGMVDRGGLETWTKTIGFKAYGTFGTSVVWSMRFVDNGTRGKNIDRSGAMNPSDAFVISNDNGSNGFDFDETEGQIGFRSSFAQFFLEKVRNTWGYGSDGQVILSGRAPSYPQLRLVVPITDRVKFTYIHAVLYSDVVDSVNSYAAIDGTFADRTVYRSKYFVSHALEYAPTDALNFAIGESMVYSDRFEPVYLIPVLFFRSLERQTRDSDNAQLFAAMRWLVPSFGSLYADLFIDDLNTNKIFSSDNTNIVAATIGGRFLDVLPDLDFTAEYTRANPWVYTHHYAATTYTSNMEFLGHWIGQNSDLIFCSAEYRWNRRLMIGASLQHLRNGPLGPESVHYSAPWEQRFLAGPLFRQTQLGVQARWEPYRDLFFHAEALVATQHDDVPARYSSFDNKLMVTVGMSYNFFSR